MAVSEESYRRAKEKYLKLLSLQGAGGSSSSPIAPVPMTSGHISSERTISTEGPIESLESEDNTGNLRKRKRLPVEKGKGVSAVEVPREITDHTSEGIQLKRFSIAGRELTQAPSIVTTENLDSLFYEAVDLVPFVSDRLLLPKDHEENMAIASAAGASQFGRMVVSDLARSYSQVLSLIPFLASQEKALAKYQGINPEIASELQSKLDGCLGELRAVKENLKEAEEEKERSQQRGKELQEELEALKKENEDLANNVTEKEAELCNVKNILTDREKSLQESQTALSSAQKALDKADLENYGMFLRGFGEAKAQIKHFNPNLEIDMSQVSEYREIQNLPPPME